MARYQTWGIVSETGEVLVRREHGHQRFVPAVKRGIPQGTMGFDTEYEAQCEAGFLMRGGFFPLYGKLTPKLMTWS